MEHCREVLATRAYDLFFGHFLYNPADSRTGVGRSNNNAREYKLALKVKH